MHLLSQIKQWCSTRFIVRYGAKIDPNLSWNIALKNYIEIFVSNWNLELDQLALKYLPNFHLGRNLASPISIATPCSNWKFRLILCMKSLAK